MDMKTTHKTAPLHLTALACLGLMACAQDGPEPASPDVTSPTDSIQTDGDFIHHLQDPHIERGAAPSPLLTLSNDRMAPDGRPDLAWRGDFKGEGRLDGWTPPIYRPQHVNYFFHELTIRSPEGDATYDGDEPRFWTGSLKLDQRGEYRVEFIKIDEDLGIMARDRFEGRYVYEEPFIHFMDEEDKLRFSVSYHYYQAGDQLWIDHAGFEQVLSGDEEFVAGYLTATRD
jgi:hypothetical protein